MTRTTRVRSLPWHGAAPIRALAAGLVGALVNTAAIRLVKLTGIPPGTGGLSKMTLSYGNIFLESLGPGYRLPNELGPVLSERERNHSVAFATPKNWLRTL